jgi:hypothetical protein
MARAVYQHELQEQDFSWLIQRFQEANPEYVMVESTALPIVLLKSELGGSFSADRPLIPTSTEEANSGGEG